MLLADLKKLHIDLSKLHTVVLATAGHTSGSAAGRSHEAIQRAVTAPTLEQLQAQVERAVGILTLQGQKE